MDNVIAISNLNHYYQEGGVRKQALFDINLEIKSGEIVLLTGESGSGKTTLLSLIGCLRKIQEGSLKVLDQELFAASELQRTQLRQRIGYVFQHFNLLEFMTICRNIQLSLELQPGFSRQQAYRKSVAVLKDVGLEHRIHAYPRELSGGQKQRVALARALVHSPQLVLADEPTAALDRKTGRDVMELIAKLAKERGSAVLVVTHDRRILDTADRIIRMEDGHLNVGYQEEISLALPTLSEERLAELEPKFNVITYPSGSVIFRKGELANNFFVVVDGTLDVIRETPNGQEAVLTQLKRSDYFGEIGLVLGSPRTATVRVPEHQSAQLIVIDRDTFLGMVSESDSTFAVMVYQIYQKLLADKKVKPINEINQLPSKNLKSNHKKVFFGIENLS